MSEYVLESNRKRCSVKEFNPKKKLNADTIFEIREIFRLTPSSVNSQGWELIVVESEEMKERLRDAAWEHNRLRFDASHILVFCSKEMNEEHRERVHETNMKISGLSAEAYAPRRAFVDKYMTGEEVCRGDWEEKQVYLALGYMLANLAILGIDSCPMEGFEPELFDEVLGIAETELHSVVAIAIGVRADNFVQGKKMRLSADETSRIM